MPSPVVHGIALATLQDVVRRAIVRFPEQRGRIERAAALIALRAVEQLEPDVYAVRSQTDDELVFSVTPAGCPCIDSQRHPELICKHVWAVDLLLVAEERTRRLAAAEHA